MATLLRCTINKVYWCEIKPIYPTVLFGLISKLHISPVRSNFTFVRAMNVLDEQMRRCVQGIPVFLIAFAWI